MSSKLIRPPLSTVLCIMGPTASGKTSLAIEAAKTLNGEVISVDSALIYIDMNIGTAKPSITEQDGVMHHLIDLISPEVTYSVADFVKDANTAIESVLKRGKLPILAGGTMMYFNALINGLNQLPAANIKIREQLNQMDQAHRHSKLLEVDPTSAARIHSSDTQRTIRALEVFISSGKPLTHWQQQDKKRLPYNFTQFSIMPNERRDLHKSIERRFDKMLSDGLLDEVKFLQQKYRLNPDLPSMRSVGYRQVLQHINGELSVSEMRERGIIATRQLAKRQVTWLRGWKEIHPLESADPQNLTRLIQKVGAT